MNVPPSQLLPYFQTKSSHVTVGLGSVTQIAFANPNRVTLAFGVPLSGGALIVIWPDASVSATQGFPFNQTEGVLIFPFRDFGTWVLGDWFATASVSGGTVNVLETIFGQGVDPGVFADAGETD